ncbi:MAG: hypothetical protein ACYCTL_12800 [Acidimicrobiales bacterium]
MLVLIPDITSAEATAIADELLMRGHGVATCTADDGRAVCAMLGGQPCPLDAASIDVTAHVCPGRISWSASGNGALCALEHRVPLVITGEHSHHPLLGRATAAGSLEDTVELVEWVHNEALDNLGEGGVEELLHRMPGIGNAGMRNTGTVERFATRGPC